MSMRGELFLAFHAKGMGSLAVSFKLLAAKECTILFVAYCKE